MRLEKRKKSIWVRSKALIRIVFYLLMIAVPIYAGFSAYKFIARPDDIVKEETQPSRGSTDSAMSVVSSEVSQKTKPLSPDVSKIKDDVQQKGTWIKIRKHEHKLYVMKDSKVIKAYGIAVGKNLGQKERAGDCRTPEGSFTVQQIQNAGSWTHDFKDGKGVIKGAYGPWFIRLKTGWNGIGIHGTHDPGSIGTDVTEGCIRLQNKDVEELKKQFIKVGLPVVIEE